MLQGKVILHYMISVLKLHVQTTAKEISKERYNTSISVTVLMCGNTGSRVVPSRYMTAAAKKPPSNTFTSAATSKSSSAAAKPKKTHKVSGALFD